MISWDKLVKWFSVEKKVHFIFKVNLEEKNINGEEDKTVITQKEPTKNWSYIFDLQKCLSIKRHGWTRDNFQFPTSLKQ